MLNVVGLTIPSGYVRAETADPTSVCVEVAIEKIFTLEVYYLLLYTFHHGSHCFRFCWATGG